MEIPTLASGDTVCLLGFNVYGYAALKMSLEQLKIKVTGQVTAEVRCVVFGGDGLSLQDIGEAQRLGIPLYGEQALLRFFDSAAGSTKHLREVPIRKASAYWNIVVPAKAGIQVS